MSLLNITLDKVLAEKAAQLDLPLSNVPADAPANTKIPSFGWLWKQMKNSDAVKHRIEAEAEYTRGGENAVRREVEEDLRLKFRDLTNEYKELDGKRCWRMITIPDKINPAKLDSIGIYWSTDKGAAESHWGNSEHRRRARFEAAINLKYVDWPSTFLARLDPTLGDEELEIRFVEKAPLYVFQVEVWEGRWWQGNEGKGVTVIPIRQRRLT